MLTIEAVNYYLPETFISVDEFGEWYGLSSHEIKVYKRIYGLDKIPIAKHMTMYELIEKPLLALLNENSINPEEIKLIIHAHTTKNLSPGGVSLPLQVKNIHHFVNATAFGVSINNCASTLSAFDIASQWLKSFDYKAKAIIITGEKTFTPQQKIIQNVSILGDASAVMLLSNTYHENKLLALKLRTNGKSANGIWMDSAEVKQFENDYTMTLVDAIMGAVQEAKLQLSDIKMIFPHNVNMPSWHKVAAALNFPIKKIYLENIKRSAHCFGADILINYVDATRKNLIAKGDYFVMATVGLGSIYGAAVFQK